MIKVFILSHRSTNFKRKNFIPSLPIHFLHANFSAKHLQSLLPIFSGQQSPNAPNDSTPPKKQKPDVYSFWKRISASLLFNTKSQRSKTTNGLKSGLADQKGQIVGREIFTPSYERARLEIRGKIRWVIRVELYSKERFFGND
jgi:hypothetical protein